ncbi:MAG: putative oxygenase MesX, partial [Comamonas sp.]
NRFNDLAHWDNPTGDRYSVELEIISVEMNMDAKISNAAFPLIEILKTCILDKKTSKRVDGIAGNNFSSYVRDYDFSVLLAEHNVNRAEFSTPADFGDLHGKLFQQFVNSSTYKKHFHKSPVICISASTSKTYQRTGNQHPVLGVEYQQNELSSTDQYFAKMGMQVRFFMPPNGVAPLAFYFRGDLLDDYSNLELIGTISTMETFQRIYRPEIYNANSAAGNLYRPSLKNQDYSLTQIVYDREERGQLAVKQGKFAQEHFIKPYKNVLEKWAANYTL